MLEHPLRLGSQNLRLVQVAASGVFQQFGVGQGRPEEVAQSAGQGMVVETTNAGARLGHLVEPEAEMRREQNRNEGVANRVLVAQSLLFARQLVEPLDRVAISACERAAEGSLSQVEQRPEVGWLGGQTVGFNVPQLAVDDVEVVADGVPGLFAGLAPFGSGQVNVSEFLDDGFVGRGLVLGPGEVEHRVAHGAGLGSLVPEKARILAGGVAGDQVKVAPEFFEFGHARLVKNQLNQRRVVAEVAGHAVEPGAQQPACIPLLSLLAQEHPGPLLDVKRIRKGGTEAFKLGCQL